MNAARNNDFIPVLPKHLPEKEQIEFLLGIIKQMHRKLINDRNDIDKLLSLVDANVSTKRLLEIIRSTYGHTESMPDKKGENTDHDKRYVTRDYSETNLVKKDESVPVVKLTDDWGIKTTATTAAFVKWDGTDWLEMGDVLTYIPAP
jgi:hypothetical protein